MIAKEIGKPLKKTIKIIKNKNRSPVSSESENTYSARKKS
jgi:hypothetical protein